MSRKNPGRAEIARLYTHVARCDFVRTSHTWARGFTIVDNSSRMDKQMEGQESYR